MVNIMRLFTPALSSKGLFGVTLLALVQRSLAACSIDGLAGSYSQHLVADFSSRSSGDDVSSIVNNAGFVIDTYAVPRQNMQYGTEQVALVDGALRLTVKADDGSGTQKGAHLTTNADFRYGSMRTVLKSSTTKGVVEGMFFYESDNAEFDWEILTQTALEKNPESPYLEAGIWATNQAIAADGEKSAVNMDPGFDPSQGYHEYRIDWDAEATTFYIDGVQRTRITTNVPQVTGPFCLNTWSSGDLGWSAGPPTTDSHTFVKSFEMFYGYSSSRSDTSCTSFRDGGSIVNTSPAVVSSSAPSSTSISSSSMVSSSSIRPASVSTSSLSSQIQQSSTTSARSTSAEQISSSSSTSSRPTTSSSSRFSTVYTSRSVSSTAQPAATSTSSTVEQTSSQSSSRSSSQVQASSSISIQQTAIIQTSSSPSSTSTPSRSTSSTPQPSATSTYQAPQPSSSSSVTVTPTTSQEALPSSVQITTPQTVANSVTAEAMPEASDPTVDASTEEPAAVSPSQDNAQ